jgi:hypothetical protein
MSFQLKNTLMQTSLAAALIVGATTAYAGNFVTLTNGNGTNLTSANGGIQTGTNNPNSDKFYIQTVNSTYVDGYAYGGFANPGNGEVVASSIDYRTFAGATTISTGTLTLLDWQVTRNVPLLEGIPQAAIFDFVYRDSSDNTLVFGTRYLNVVNNNQEANYLYRAGFEDYSASAAWTFSTDYDLRMYQAALSSDYTYDSSILYDADVVRQKGDFSVSEGNPWSGLFLVKTNATDYILGDKAIGFYQAGEEGQSVVGGFIGGFVPTTIAAVPEPENYALMVAGLGLVGFASRRKKD